MPIYARERDELISRHVGFDWRVKVREKEIERKLVRAVKAAGGICPKLISPGMNGMPDRLVLLPEGRVGFVEVKAPGRRPRVLQDNRHKLLRRLGFPVFVLDDPLQIPWIIEEVGDAGRRTQDV